MLHSRYKLLDKLAVGGMAEVYRAVYTAEEGFEKIVVIKRILPHLTHDKNLIKSFIDEARLAALLQHESIVKTFDFGKAGDDYFIAMEYLSGKSLRDIIEQGRKNKTSLSMEDALLIISRVCAGLSYAHQLKDLSGHALNIIHRDISPANIFITYDGQVKVIDFGIAKAESQNSNTQFGIIKGKFSYMAPEQAFDGSIDHRSDIFSLGSVMYELLTRRRLFDGDMYQALAKLNKMAYVPPGELAPELPEALCRIIEHSLERDPVARYQSCAEILLDIEDCIFDMKMRISPLQLERHMTDMFAEDMEKEDRALQNLVKGVHSDADTEGLQPSAPPAEESTMEMPAPAPDPLETTRLMDADSIREAGQSEPEEESLQLELEKDSTPPASGEQPLSPEMPEPEPPAFDETETVYSLKAPKVGTICFQCGERVKEGELLCDACSDALTAVESASVHSEVVSPEPASEPAIRKKICVIGAFATGKTNLIHRFVNNGFIEAYTHLAGINIEKKQIRFENLAIDLEIWELPGVDPYHRLNTSYLKDADGLVVVVDGNRPPTLVMAEDLKRQADVAMGRKPFILVVNKSDQSREWLVDRNQLSVLRRKGWTVHRASAKSGVGVAKAFMMLAEQLIDVPESADGETA